MPGGNRDGFIDELVSRTDIVSVVSRRVQLTRKGNRYWGLCPFHGEKTASFSVNPQMQMYYCFGCHAAGGAIRFVMEMDHLDFKEAAVQLAEEVHMEVPQNFLSSRDNPQRREEKERLYALNRECARYYYKQLFETENAGVLAYFHERGLSDSTIRRFGLGASPRGENRASEYLLGLGFSKGEIVAAGVAQERGNRLVDMFRGRAMFPIIDARDRVLGFGGRNLGKELPKYVNTGDTPIFNKRMGVYCANLLRKERNLQRVILTEGYMDAISLYQAGLKGVCATLGTALTEEQARLLKRYAPEVWVSYDGDGAGQKAIVRALTIFDLEKMPCRVLDFPDGMDPDEYVRAYGAEGMAGLQPKDGVIYRMERLRDGVDMSTQEGRTSYAIACAPLIAKVPEPVQRENYVQRLMQETGFAREVLLDQLSSAQGQIQDEEQRQQLRKMSAPRPAAGKEPPEAAPERMLLGLLASGGPARETIRPEDFITQESREVAQALLGGRSAAAVLDGMGEEMRAKFARLFSEEERVPDGLQMQMVNDCLIKLHRLRLDTEIRELQGQLQTLTGEAQTAALGRIQELIRQRNVLGKEG